MDIYDLPPAEAARLTHARYHGHLRALHEIVKIGGTPSVGLMETLEQSRQLEEMAAEHLMRSAGVAA